MSEFLFSFSRQDYQVLFDALDDQFARIIADARVLSDRWTDEGKARKIFLPALITVIRDKRSRSVTLRWTKTSPKSKASGGGMNQKALNKGRDTFYYPPSTFDFMEPSLRATALEYERLLGVMRYALAQNCAVYARLRNISKGLDKEMFPAQGGEMA